MQIGRHGGGFLSVVVPLCLILSACVGGLGGEPRIIATLPRPPAEDILIDYAPNLTRGAAIFAQHCARCHGDSGAGDGELVLAGDVPAMRSFTAAGELEETSPAGWFEVITNGRIDRFMPPWSGALTTAERWDVTLYIYNLRYTPEQAAAGEALWAATCTDCHPVNTAAGWQQIDRQALFAATDADLATLIMNAHDDATSAVSALDIDQQTALIAYLRLFGSEPAPSNVVVETIGVIGGQIVNGTAGGSVPSNLAVTLFIFDSGFSANSPPQRLETTSDASGRYRFDDVPLRADSAYAAGVAYQDRLFISDFARPETAQEALELPVTIYERTADPAVISITALSGQITPVGGGLEIVQFFRFRNASDYVFSTDIELADNLYTSVELPLPRGAQPLRMDADDERFITRADPPALIDTVPVLPGEDHIVRIAYFLPLAGSEISVAQPVAYPFEGRAEIVIHPNTIALAGGGFVPVETEDSSRATGIYYADLTLEAGDAIVFGLNARPAAATTGLVPTEQLALIVIAIGAGLILTGAIMGLRMRVGSK